MASLPKSQKVRIVGNGSEGIEIELGTPLVVSSQQPSAIASTSQERKQNRKEPWWSHVLAIFLSGLITFAVFVLVILIIDWNDRGSKSLTAKIFKLN